jgi:uncharacterized protein (DUF1697 family)
MTTYVALLRGINVGGKTKVDMKTLKDAFESDLGCSSVKTYINSGNVVFRDRRGPAKLATAVEGAIRDRFELDVPVLIRDLDNIRALCENAIPADWTNDKGQRTDVLFLWEEFDSPDVLDSIAWNPEIEDVRYAHGAVIWNISRANATRGKMNKLAGTELYRKMTIRNVNTVRKLHELMEAIA